MHSLLRFLGFTPRKSNHRAGQRKSQRRAFFEQLEDRRVLATFAEFLDPNPAPGNRFGDTVLPLSTGNVVITSPYDDASGTDAGAVYLFNGATGELISTLRGSSANDQIGNGGVTALANGNYVVRSSDWANGAAVGAGAVTWGSGISGVSGVVSAVNSLVGGTAVNQVGSGGVTALANGNYVISSPGWDNGSPGLNAGAITWANGLTGVTGVVSTANSLVGSTKDNQVGSGGVTALPSGNYVVCSPNWDNGSVTDVGAATWLSGAGAMTGVVNAANSLVGGAAYDRVGSGGVTILTNGNYVVRSYTWSNGRKYSAGAVTWGSGTSGVTGVVSVANSLTGSNSLDQVGSRDVIALSNGNYVVCCYLWSNGSEYSAGAVTWGSGTSGVSGVISAANSLVGTNANDFVGFGGVYELTNGNYVVRSYNWDNGAIQNAGAVTWGSGETGVSGAVSAANSLVGSTVNDLVGFGGVTVLSNGNYVVNSSVWDNGSTVDAGAVTWVNGATGEVGSLNASNSLVGGTENNRVGGGGRVTALSNGNYVVSSPFWDNGAIADVGAVTWANGDTGIVGVVSVANSLIGTKANDYVGRVYALPNGNYVVVSPSWDSDSAPDVGAVTWQRGDIGTSGNIDAAHSLVGTTANDQIGSEGITVLANGSYLVRSPNWDNGSVTDAGAITWQSGDGETTGVVSAANSLVGSTTSDKIGDGLVTILSNGNYVVRSLNWDNGSATDAGAITWGSGLRGASGAVSPANSAVGSMSNAGLSGVVLDDSNGTFFARFLNENGGRVYVGSQTSGFNTAPVATNGSDTINEDESLTINLRLLVSDGQTADDELIYTLVSVTNGVAVPTATPGVFEFTPAADFHGTAVITYNVTDAEGVTSTPDNTFTVTVTPVNDPATISGTATGSVAEDGALTASGTLNVSDVDTGEAAFAIPASLAGTYGTFTFDANTGEWNYALDNTLAAVQALVADATVSDTLTVASLDGTASQDIIVTITGANDLATISGTATGSVTEDGAFTTSGTLSVSDVDTDEARFAVPVSLAGIYGTFTLNADTGEWSYTLDNSLVAVQSLAAGATVTDSLTVESLDGKVSQDIVVTITGENDGATISGTATGSITEDEVLTVSGTLSVNDTDSGEATFAVPMSLAGIYGTFTFDADTGAWTYVLDNALASVQALVVGETVTDTLTVQSLDGTASQDIVVTITGSNDPATISGAATGNVVEDDPLIASGTLSVSDVDAEEAKFAVPASLAGTYGTFTFDADTGEWTYSLDNNLAAVQALTANQQVIDTLTVQSLDGTASQDIVVTITGSNEAPLLNVSVVPALQTIAEDSKNPWGTPIWQLLGGMTDIDGNNLRGVALTGLGGNGTWQYTLDGISWNSLSSASLSSALLLPAAGNLSRLRFVPAANFPGTVNVQFVGWDQTAGVAGDVVDLSSAASRGGSTAYSEAEGTASLTISPVNDAPKLNTALSPTLTAINENNRNAWGTPVWTLLQGYSDVDAGALKGLAITSASGRANGAWQYTLDGGATWLDLGAVSLSSAKLLPAQGNLSRVRFVPNANYHGTVQLGYFAWDQTQGVSGGTFDLSGSGKFGGTTAFGWGYETASLTVKHVNTPPRLTLPSAPVGYALNSPAVLLASTATLKDPDTVRFARGWLKVQITAGSDAQDRLSIGGAFKIVDGNLIWNNTATIGTVQGGAGSSALMVKLNADATLYRVEQLVRSIKFGTLGSSKTGLRTVAFSLSDGTSTSNVASLDVQIG